MVHGVGPPPEMGNGERDKQDNQHSLLPGASCMSSPPVVPRQPDEVGLFSLFYKGGSPSTLIQ